MTSVDFAAAQQRVAERQRQRDAETRSQFESRRSAHASNALSRLPPNLQGIGQRGLAAWDVIRGREGTRPAYRVGQVDAELLDEELLELLKGQVGEGLKYFGSHIRDDWSSEILLGLRAVLFKLSIWDHNASYGAALQNLRYTDARQKGLVSASPTKWQKTLYGLLTVGGRYGWTRWEDWLAEQDVGYEGPSPSVRILSRMSSIASTTHSIAAFVSFLTFLVNGRYRTLLDRILRMRLAPPSSQVSREISFEYLNRQLVWHAFTEFLLFLLPLVGISRWRRWLSRAWRKTKALVKSDSGQEDDMTKEGELAFLPERTCAICYQDQNPTLTSENEIRATSAASVGVVGSAQTDITNPYQTIPCCCIYCFVCLAKRLEAEEGVGWICLRCGELVKECRPWAGDVLEQALSPPKQKAVSFSDEEDPGQPQYAKRSGSGTSEKDRNLPHLTYDSSHEQEPAISQDLMASQEWAREEAEPGTDVRTGE